MFSANIRQRLLENKTLDLKTAYDQAYFQIQRRKMQVLIVTLLDPTYCLQAAAVAITLEDASVIQNVPEANENDSAIAAAYTSNKTFFYVCGNNYHNRNMCPAHDILCHKCGKNGTLKSLESQPIVFLFHKNGNN